MSAYLRMNQEQDSFPDEDPPYPVLHVNIDWFAQEVGLSIDEAIEIYELNEDCQGIEYSMDPNIGFIKEEW